MANNLTTDTRTKQQRQAAFLDAYIECLQLTKAAKVAGVNRITVYSWEESDPNFLRAFEIAKKLATQRLAEEAHRRAFEGVEKPVYQMGLQVGTIREYSDALIQFLLKSADPKTYATLERRELTGKDGGPIQTQDVTIIDL